MIPARRMVLRRGVGLLAFAAVPVPARVAAAQAVTEVAMEGSPRGEHVAFAPRGAAVAPGATIRFVNRDAGNSHTATSYHPAILDRLRRIPEGAAPWDSGLLLPGESFAVTLTVPGVYDLYCQPHEAAGMVARLVVGRPQPGTDWELAGGAEDLPPAARAAFPSVAEILASGSVLPSG